MEHGAWSMDGMERAVIYIVRLRKQSLVFFRCNLLTQLTHHHPPFFYPAIGQSVTDSRKQRDGGGMERGGKWNVSDAGGLGRVESTSREEVST